MNEQRILEAVRYPIGLTADPAQDNGYLRQAYLEFIAPGETPQRQAEMARMSGCALVVAGIWRRIGVRHPLLDAPYVDETAVSRLWEIALRAGATRSWISLGELRIGDVVRVAHPEHVWTATGGESWDHAHYAGVDGGQLDGEYQCVRKVLRWIELGKEKRHGDRDRVVMDRIDVRKVIEAFGDKE